MSSATNLLADIKVRAFLYASQQTLTDAEILDLSSKELRGVVAPKIVSTRDSYWETYKDYTITSLRAYKMPSRRIGGRISRVVLFDSNNTTDPEEALIKRHPADAKLFGKYSYTIRGEYIVLNDDSLVSGTLRVYFNLRPGVLSTTAPTAVTVVSNTTVTAPALTGTYDICSTESPFNVKAYDVTFSAGTATVPLEAQIAVGDAVVAQDTSYYVPMAIELHDWLALRCAIRLVGILGQKENQAILRAELADVEQDIMALITPRAEDDEKIVLNKETLGLLDWK